MAAWSYENEQERLCLFEEVPTYSEAEDTDQSLEEDDIEIQNDDSEREEEISDDELDRKVALEGSRKFRGHHLYQKMVLATRTMRLRITCMFQMQEI